MARTSSFGMRLTVADPAGERLGDRLLVVLRAFRLVLLLPPLILLTLLLLLLQLCWG
jgi:hypothetical protein